MDEDSKNSIPLLTAENFLEWRFKMKNLLRGKGLYRLVSGEKIRNDQGQFVSADSLSDLKDKALAIISPKIHKSLISTVIANGGEDDPVILWSNIMAFGSSKKEANIFRAYRNLYLLTIDPTNISSSILKFRDAIAELQSLDLDLDKRQIGHLILLKIPPTLAAVQDAVINTGQTSTEVTYNLVLDILDNKAKTTSIAVTPPKSDAAESDAATALLTYLCRDGKHSPKANHSASQCFALHPKLLEEYRARLKDRNKSERGETYLASVVEKEDQSHLATAFAGLATDQGEENAYESDVSLL